MSRRDFTILIAVCAVFTLVRECTSEVCDIDFHMESSSLMLMEGDNASAVCDATCFDGQGEVRVTWLDAHARPISSFPGRVFSVRYNRGLMNRLMMIGARTVTAGVYVCSVSRNGDLLTQQPLEVVVVGNNGNSNNFRPVDTGPRRGDMIPERDLEYRPVRSAGRRLSQFPSRSESSAKHPGRADSHRKLNSNAARVSHSIEESALPGKSWLNPQPGLHPTRTFHNMDKDDDEQTGNFHIFNKQKQVPKSEATAYSSDDILTSSAEELSKMPRWDLGNQNDDGMTIMEMYADQILNQRKAGRQTAGDISGSDGLSRVKRQQGVSITTTQDTFTTENATTPTGSDESDSNETTDSNEKTSEMTTESTSNTVIDTGESGGGNVEQTSTSDRGNTEEETETATIQTGNTQTETTRKELDGKNGQDSTTPFSRAQENVNFGKYGVLAFALTLAVAVLLMYTILMIIFMPRIMAKRKQKQNIEGGAYRKTGLECGNMVTILESGEVTEPDPVQDKVETSELDRSGSGSDTSDSGKRDGDSKEISASVSTFLLRQESMKQSEDGEEVSSEKSAKPEEGADKSGKPPTSADPASATEPNHHEPQTTPAGTGLKDDDKLPPPTDDLLLSSFLPGLDVPGNSVSTLNHP